MASKNHDERAAATLGEGIYRGLWRTFIIICVIWQIATLFSVLPFFRDSTDPAGWGFNRSGLKPYIDAETGCEYLSSEYGMITRMNAEGRQICRGGYVSE